MTNRAANDSSARVEMRSPLSENKVNKNWACKRTCFLAEAGDR